jgi:hypothetical protein
MHWPLPCKRAMKGVCPLDRMTCAHFGSKIPRHSVGREYSCSFSSMRAAGLHGYANIVDNTPFDLYVKQ